jgi:hypothetical protein
MKTTDCSSALTGKEIKDLRLLALFIDCWCQEHHDPLARQLLDKISMPPGLVPDGHRFCPECRELLAYAIARRRACPLNPKPVCKDCPIHCYKPVHRATIRNIMRFSGRHLILRGRFDLLWHYFF